MIFKKPFGQNTQDEFLNTLLKSNEPTWVVVPNHYLGLSLKNELAKKNNGHAGIYFFTFLELAKNLCLPKHPNLKTAPTEFIEHTLLQCLMEGEFKFLNHHLSNIDLWLEHLVAMITDFSKHEVKLHDSFNQKLKDLIRLKDMVEARLNAKEFVLPHQWLNLAQNLDRRVDTPTYIYGFESIDVIENKLIQKSFKNVTLYELTALTQANDCTIYEFNDTQQEYEWIAKTIIKNKMNYEETCVLIQSSHDMATLISVFHRANIPYYSSHGEPLIRLNVFRSLLILLQMDETYISRNQLIDFLFAYPFVQSLNHKHHWHQIAHASGLNQLDDHYMQTIKRSSYPFEYEHVLHWVLNLKKTLNQQTSYKGFYESFLDPFLKHLDQTRSDVLELKRFIFQIKKLDGLVPFSPKVLSRSIQKGRLNTKRFIKSGVFIGDYPDGMMFKNTFVPSFCDGVYPTYHTQSLDHEEINHINKTIESSIEQASHTQQTHRFNTFLRSAILSFSKSDLTGQERYVSTLIQNPNFVCQDHDDVPIDESDLCKTLVKLNPFDRLNVQAIDPTYEAFINYQVSINSNQLTAFDGVVDGLGLKSKFDLTSYHIQEFFTCPYKYYLNRVLNVKKLTNIEDQYGFDPKDRGRLLHQILFEFYTHCKSINALPLKHDQVPFDHLSLIIDKLKNDHQSKLIEYEFIKLEQYSKNIIEDDFKSEWIPKYFELAFGLTKYKDGEHGIDKPLFLSDEEYSYFIRGVIDRLDLNPNQQSIQIIDYKTSKTIDQDDNSLNNGQNVQLLIYLLASLMMFENIDLKSSVSKMKNIHLKTAKIDGDHVLSLLEEFKKLLNKMAKSINKGLFFPNPGKNQENCHKCDFRPICKDHVIDLHDRKIHLLEPKDI